MDNKQKSILNFDKVSNRARGCCVVTLLLLLVYQPSFGQFATEPISIERINIDEATNSLLLLCSFADGAMVDKVENESASLRLDISNDDTVFEDVIITKKKRYSENALLISVQPPLEASIYKTRKRDFILQLSVADQNAKSDKSAVLGSAFKTFDLRPYTNTDSFYLLITSILLFLMFSVVLFLIKPLLQKFRFKRDHIMKFLKAREEGKSRIDPFTFVNIEDDDQVVAVDDKVLLLSSWKRLKKIPHSQPTLTHAVFFEQMSDRSFFNPWAEKFGKTDRAWYGLIGIFSGWLLYSLFLHLEMAGGHGILAIFNGDGLQVSTVIAHDLLLGMAVGFCYATILAVVDHLRAKVGFTVSSMVKIILPRAFFIIGAFFIQALITVYLIENPYINAFIAWCLMGIAFIFPLNFKEDIAKKCVIGLGIGLLSYVVYLLMGIPYLRDLWGTNIALFVGLALIGCLGPIMRDAPISRRHVAQLKEIRFYRALRKIGKQKRSTKEKIKQEDNQVLQEP